MGMILIYSLIFLLIFLTIGIVLFVYSINKKSKIGLVISSIIILLVGLFFLTNTIDENSISKKDITSDLKFINIKLNDDFVIVNNKVSGMPERIQNTEIEISQSDKDRIISEIKNSTNFKLFGNEQEIIDNANAVQFGAEKIIYNFKYPEFYSRETYTEVDNFPTRLILSIYEKSNRIIYQRIED
jgi:hypothetical protein